MIVPNSVLVRFLSWIAERLGLRFHLDESLFIDPLDEQDVIDELHFGRD